ncbi:MAG: hypothetical protein LBI67_08100, partial [Treponema sp.]|nr:hypothetical protein [Treponema sp.]
MIRFDNVDKEPIMNDIIAAQHVQRRKASLLSSAADRRADFLMEGQRPAYHRSMPGIARERSGERGIRSALRTALSFVAGRRAGP